MNWWEKRWHFEGKYKDWWLGKKLLWEVEMFRRKISANYAMYTVVEKGRLQRRYIEHPAWWGKNHFMCMLWTISPRVVRPLLNRLLGDPYKNL